MNKYEKYFRVSKRMSSQKKISLVRGNLFEAFINELVEDSEIATDLKCLFIVSLCGGLRVSELLSIRKSQFTFDDGILWAEVKVLKKRNENITRTIRIHPLATKLVQEYLSNKIGLKAFTMSVRTAQRAVTSTFNIEHLCPHSWRHSSLSYLLFEVGLTKETVSKLVNCSSSIIDVYAHVDSRHTLSKLPWK